MNDGLLIGCTEVGNTNTIPVLVANLMKKPQVIKKGGPAVTVSHPIK